MFAWANRIIVERVETDGNEKMIKETKWRTPQSRLRVCLLAWALVWAAAPLPVAASEPAGHAPIGVMGDHTHHKGETMLSYRYMRMGMDGMRNNDDRVSRSEVLQDFMVTPISMDMQMHMFGAMYAPIEKLTVMLMVPFVQLDMDHRTRAGTTFKTHSEGLGDITATGLVDLWKHEGHKIHANLGISFPSGSITKQDKNPMSAGAKVRLPYPMQIGSGTYDFLPGLTYNGHSEAWTWGAQVTAAIRLNENHAGYRLGDEYALTAWGARELTNWVSASLRLEWLQNVNIRGRDDSSSVNPAVVPTADPGRQAAMRLDVLAGLNFAVPTGPLSGVRFALEAGVPAYELLDGPALETDWILTVGTQYAF